MAYHPFRRLGLKSLSLALATLIWLLVARDQTVERNVSAPIEFQNHPDGLSMVGDAPESVDIRLRGPSTTLSRLAAGDVVAVVDLSNARPGQRVFHLLEDGVRVPTGVRVTQLMPANVTITFEPSDQRAVSVKATVTGEPAAGFVVGAVTANPSQVEVAGAESRLLQLREVAAEPVSVAGADAPIHETVNIGVQDPQLRLVGVRSVLVSVSIDPAPVERRVDGVRIDVRGVSGKGTAVAPERAALTIAGAPSVVGAIDPQALTLYVDASGFAKGRYRASVRADLPQGVELRTIDPPTIELTIR